MDSMISIVCNCDSNTYDFMIPASLPVNELIRILAHIFRPQKEAPSFLRCDNPVVLLSGSMDVASVGLHDGSTIYI